MIALLTEHYAYHGALSTSVLIAILALSLAVSAGYMTPIIAVACVLFHSIIWFRLSGADAMLTLIVLLDSLALALLGPGAYSVDAYRYGRRVVVLPLP